MRKFKLVSNIMLIIASILFVASPVVTAIVSSKDAGSAAFIVVLMASQLILASAGVGVFLMFAKNDTAKKIGNGISIAAYVTGLVCALGVVFQKASLGAVLMIAAVVFFLLRYVFLLVDYLINKNDPNATSPNEDIRIIRVKEWKKLMEEGIITKDEFEQKRIQLLGIKSETE